MAYLPPPIIVSVLQFPGVDPTGTTDSAPGLRLALAYCKSLDRGDTPAGNPGNNLPQNNNLVLDLQGSSLLLNSTVEMPGVCNLTVANGTLRAGAGNTSTLFQDQQSSSPFWNAGVKFSRVIFDGAHICNTCLFVRFSDKLTVEDCFFTGWSENGYGLQVINQSTSTILRGVRAEQWQFNEAGSPSSPADFTGTGIHVTAADIDVVEVYSIGAAIGMDFTASNIRINGGVTDGCATSNVVLTGQAGIGVGNVEIIGHTFAGGELYMPNGPQSVKVIGCHYYPEEWTPGPAFIRVRPQTTGNPVGTVAIIGNISAIPADTLSPTATLTLSATTGQDITATSNELVFSASDIGRTICAPKVSAALGSPQDSVGMMIIRSVPGQDQVRGDVIVPFTSTSISANAWSKGLSFIYPEGDFGAGLPFFDGSMIFGNVMSQIAGISMFSTNNGKLPQAYLQTTMDAANVVVSADGSFFRSVSGAKYKVDVRDVPPEMVEASKALRPRLFKDIKHPSGRDYAGLIAEEVHAAGVPELVGYDADGNPDSVMYDRLPILHQARLADIEERLAALEGSSP